MTSSGCMQDWYEDAWLDYIFKKSPILLAGGTMTEDGPASCKLVLFTDTLANVVAAHTSTMPAIDGVGSKEPTSAQYPGYARLSVTRNGTEWSVTGTAPTIATKATNDAVFATSGAGSGCTILTCGLAMARKDATGDVLLYAWDLLNDITVSNGIAPRINAGALVHEQA